MCAGMLSLLITGLLASRGAVARCPMGGASGVSLAGDQIQSEATRNILFANTGPIDPTDAIAQADIPPLSAYQYAAIQADLEVLLGDSQPHFPADFGTYRGLMIRLAWHCSGTYRQSDGRGGCDGGRIRFAPEFQWEDNTNLDKALDLLQPLYDKYEGAISWCVSFGVMLISRIRMFCSAACMQPNLKVHVHVLHALQC